MLRRWVQTIIQRRFNRYMVECECVSLLISSAYLQVLIDTWWNVNGYTNDKRDEESNVLIDTWWNVNISAKDIVNNAIQF